MSTGQLKLALTLCALGLFIAWVALMISFWLPGFAGTALQSTALTLGIPSLCLGVGGFIFAEEITAEHEKRARPMRCTDCGTKILNAGGTTVGDHLEGELMMLEDRRKDNR